MKGVASKAMKTGRYSDLLPRRMVESFVASMQDENLLEMREEVALVDSRLQDLLTRVESGESEALWRAIQERWNDFNDAYFSGDDDALMRARTDLERVITRGIGDFGVWNDILRLVNTRAKLVSQERKRLIQLNQTITTEKAMVLVHALVEAVKAHVSDQPTLAAIAKDFNGILGGGGGNALVGGQSLQPVRRVPDEVLE